MFYDWQAILSDLHKCIKQELIAEKLGVTQPFVSYLINGRRATVSHEVGVKILLLCAEHGIEQHTKQKAQSVS
jgi:predicted XRE-type DNA-binding protein